MTTATTESTYKGSLMNMVNTQKAIAERYGEIEAKRYDPRGNCFTEKLWKKKGFKIKKDEKALIRIPTVKTFFKRDEITGEMSPSGRRPASAVLYYILQVEPI